VSSSRGTRRIYAFFAKHAQDSINVHGEAQRVMQNLKLERWWKNFELDCFPMPTFDIFQDLIRDSAAQNVVVAYFAGHCGEGGALCFNTVGSNVEMEMLGPDQVAPVIARASNGVSARAGGATIECVVLNACHTRALGVALRAKGVAHVVCWHGTVLDSHAIKFAEAFFMDLAASPTEYNEAFEAGQRAVARLDPRAVRRLCFLSASFLVDLDDDALDSAHASGSEAGMPLHAAGQSGGVWGVGGGGWEGGSIGGDGNADVARMANNVKGRFELKGFRALGVVLEFQGNDVEEGIRLYEARHPQSTARTSRSTVSKSRSMICGAAAPKSPGKSS